VVAAQPAGIDGDLVLLDPTAPRHHVGHARDLPELALQHPVLKRLHLDERHRLGLERVAINLADRAGQRPQPRLGVGWQLGPGDPPEHLLAGPAVVGAVGAEAVDGGDDEEPNESEHTHAWRRGRRQWAGRRAGQALVPEWTVDHQRDYPGDDGSHLYDARASSSFGVLGLGRLEGGVAWIGLEVGS